MSQKPPYFLTAISIWVKWIQKGKTGQFDKKQVYKSISAEVRDPKKWVWSYF